MKKIKIGFHLPFDLAEQLTLESLKRLQTKSAIVTIALQKELTMKSSQRTSRARKVA